MSGLTRMGQLWTQICAASWPRSAVLFACHEKNGLVSGSKRRKFSDSQRSPIFIQFIDCVYQVSMSLCSHGLRGSHCSALPLAFDYVQLTVQFPSSFEFNP